jgi:hypothetical protein
VPGEVARWNTLFARAVAERREHPRLRAHHREYLLPVEV